LSSIAANGLFLLLPLLMRMRAEEMFEHRVHPWHYLRGRYRVFGPPGIGKSGCAETMAHILAGQEQILMYD